MLNQTQNYYSSPFNIRKTKKHFSKIMKSVKNWKIQIKTRRNFLHVHLTIIYGDSEGEVWHALLGMRCKPRCYQTSWIAWILVYMSFINANLLAQQKQCCNDSVCKFAAGIAYARKRSRCDIFCIKSFNFH